MNIESSQMLKHCCSRNFLLSTPVFINCFKVVDRFYRVADRVSSRKNATK